MTDAAGQVYRDSVGALGVPFFSYDPGGRATATTYDAAGRVASATNRRGLTVGFGYDPALGFLSSRTAADPANAASINATYGTDALGRVRWARNAEGADTVFADSLGRDTLAVHWIPGGPAYQYVVRSGYDALGRRNQVTYDRYQNGVRSQIAGNSN